MSMLNKLKKIGKNSRFLSDLDLHSEEGCIQIFRYFDGDHDGILDNAETRKFLEKLWKQKLNDGRDDVDTKLRDEFVEDLIDQLDVNDGRLSWEDLLRRRDVISKQLGGDPEKELEEARVRRRTIEKTRRTTRTSSFFGLNGAVSKVPPPPPQVEVEPADRTSLKVPHPVARPGKGSSKYGTGDKRASEWIKHLPQFAKYAPKFALTTWDQLLEYTVADLRAMDIPGLAAVPLSKVIAALKEEARISTSERSKSLNSSEGQVPSDYELDSPRPTFSYNNRVFTAESRAVTLEALFEELAEGKGAIGEKEVAIALNRFGVVDGEEGPQTKAWFNEIDRDCDGLIDQEEFVELMSVAHDMIFSMSKSVPAFVDTEDCENTVFLGGSCNPTTWRQDIVMPLFRKAGVSFYNPQKENWHEGLVAIEARAKAQASLLFFVIDPLTLALASMIECTELITSGRPLILVINDLPPNSKLSTGEDIPLQVLKDANRARAYLADVAIRNRIQPYSSILRAACEVIQFLHGGWMGGYEEGRSRSSTRLYEEHWHALKRKMKGKPSPLVKTRATSPTLDEEPPRVLVPSKALSSPTFTVSPPNSTPLTIVTSRSTPRKHTRSPSLDASPVAYTSNAVIVNAPLRGPHARTMSFTPGHVPGVSSPPHLPPPPHYPPPPPIVPPPPSSFIPPPPLNLPPPATNIPPPSTPPPMLSTPSTPPFNIPPPPTPPPVATIPSPLNIPPPSSPPPNSPLNVPPPLTPSLTVELSPFNPTVTPHSPISITSPISPKGNSQEWASIIKPPPLPPPPPLPSGIVLLGPPSTPPPMSTCPLCDRAVESSALDCPFCGVLDTPPKPPSPRARRNMPAHKSTGDYGDYRHLGNGDFSGVGSEDVGAGGGDYSGLGSEVHKMSLIRANSSSNLHAHTRTGSVGQKQGTPASPVLLGTRRPRPQH